MTENKNHPDTDLSGLHLSDEMIGLLKSGKINTRLLCEMAVHRDFVKLMADIEIYVDGIAAMQIQSLNSVVDLARVKIIGQYRPGENDRIIETLEAAHINEDRYFSDVVHGDIDRIIRDIRETHKGDSTSAPELSVAAQLKKALTDAENFKGSTQEKQIAALLGQLGIDYNRLSPEEMRVLMKAFGKSKHLKSPGSKRGKKRK